MNYRFKLDEWLPKFPLREMNGYYYVQAITSPSDLCQNEILRRELRDEFDWGEPVPIDIFVMADGEPPDRHVTKLGGLPYRAADASWPVRRNGLPLVFLGQFDFSDSRDLTGPLPGDVLLVFADDAYMPENLHFEWQNFGLEGLIEQHAIPIPPERDEQELENYLEYVWWKLGPLAKQLSDRPDIASYLSFLRGQLGMVAKDVVWPTNAFAPCYGHICRVQNYPHWRFARDDVDRLTLHGKSVNGAEYYLATYQATQIGAAPYFIQQGDPNSIIGRMLCTIGSVQPAADVPYPWINRPEAIPLESRHTDEHLMIGDMGCIYIYIDENMELNWHMSCF
jgi:hypothetical protein